MLLRRQQQLPVDDLESSRSPILILRKCCVTNMLRFLHEYKCFAEKDYSVESLHLSIYAMSLMQSKKASNRERGGLSVKETFRGLRHCRKKVSYINLL